MKTRTRAIFIAVAASLLLVLVLAPLSKAQVAAISKRALLIQKGVLSLPAKVLGLRSSPAPSASALNQPAVKTAGVKPLEVVDGVIVGRSVKNDTSPPLRDIPPAADALELEPEHEANPNPSIPNNHKDEPDTAVQGPLGAPPGMPPTILNFDGVPFPGVGCNCAPPDTDGAVGATQFMQQVNNAIQVFDKTTGTSLLGPIAPATLWTGFGGVCEFNGNGDPIVLYDKIANRWLISQFAGIAGPQTDECVAISVSADATDAYYRYDFTLGTNFFDYPKIGTWPDGYYMAMNVFNTTGTVYMGPQAFAFDRSQMLIGAPATFVSPVGPLGGTVAPFLPSDLDGPTLPPANAPNTFVGFPGDPVPVYNTYHFHADFAVPGNSTFTTFATPPAAAFTALCPGTRQCVPQLGQPSTSNLDGIGDRMMHRLAYRNFGDHEAVVTNYTVSSGGVAGVRWIELRGVTAGPVTVFQESTYQPDTTWRWMGSAAMDHSGDLVVGFSASSATIFPQIRYAGRLVGDPINTLAQGEAHLFDGTGAQQITGNRWGDYSALSVDPVDDCTFWYTQEYYATTGQFNWRTRIGNFKFPSCSVLTPTPTPTGPTVTSTPTRTPSSTPTPTPTACGGINPWTLQAPAPANILDQAAAAVGTNVYEFAGVGNGAFTTAARKYDSILNSWSLLTAFPGGNREGPVAVSDGTQFIYIMGGVAGGVANVTTHRYDTVLNTYLAEASFTTGRWAAGAAYINGKVYLIGGQNAAGTALNSLQIYTVSTNTWAAGAALPLALGFPSATAMTIGGNDYVFVAGGLTGNTAHEKTYRYDIAANTWDDASIADLSATRWGVVGSGIVNGKWVLAGGVVSGLISSSAVAWDPVTNTWSSAFNMVNPSYRGAGASTGVALFAIGGNLPFTGTADNQRYLPLPCPTNTPTNTPSNTPTQTAVPPTNTPTNTPVPPTDTPTNTPVPPTNTPTNTAVPPTNTPTNTPVPPTNTPTNTAVPPTNTPTNTAVPPTNTPTNTAVPPTNTPTNTPVPPTNTPTSTPSNTPVPPTNTPSNTPSNTPPPSPTLTSSRTNTPTATPTTPPPSATNTPTNTPGASTPTPTPTKIVVVPPFTDFRDVRRPPDINVGPDLGGTGHTAMNFTGSAGAAGDTWITVYDTTPGDGTPGTQNNFGSLPSLTADVLVHAYNNKKGAGVLALFNEGVNQKGLALVIYNNGNTDTLALGTMTKANGTFTVLTTVSLGNQIGENTWYRLVASVTVTGPNVVVTGKVFRHTVGTDPNSPLGTQVGGTLTFSGARPAGVDATGEVGMVGQASSAVIDSSVTNFVIDP